MSDKKQVFLSLETAKEMWKNENIIGLTDYTLTQRFLLNNFTQEELEAKELPKSWYDLENVKGYYINNYSNIFTIQGDDCKPSNTSRNTFPTKELAEASLALSQLLQLRDIYNGDWKVDLDKKPSEVRYYIYNRFNLIEKQAACSQGINHILSFEKQNIRDQFYKNFQDLLEIAKPLL